MILIIDFGSQYNQLIARRVRENHVYCQIELPHITSDAIDALKPEGIILSGGPASIYEANSPKVEKAIFEHFFHSQNLIFFSIRVDEGKT